MQYHFFFQITKKLAGNAKGTASWMTNVGNEYGQVLVSVLTVTEGEGLKPLVDGLIERYVRGNVNPPILMYVDRDCCGDKFRKMFQLWPDMTIRLDIWHLMRRFADGCSSNSHPLYGTFMAHLSGCLFEWDREDVDRLREAKRSELLAEGIANLSAGALDKRISKKELALHCRRTTRGVEVTTRSLEELITTMSGPAGLSEMGVPLFNQSRMEVIWRLQKRHILCIQDPPGVQLYTKVRELKKGGVVLPVYRCARGSTSLESFHLHVARFVPGISIELHII